MGYIYQKKSPTAADMLSFIKENPQRASLHYIQDGEVKVAFHSEKVMPLASTVKTVIAIEYARQSAQGKLQPKNMVSLDGLDMYYLPNLDGGAHSAWRTSLEQKGAVKNGMVSLEEVAKGMIQYSSNANTEYLMQRLGKKNIDQTLVDLGFSRHEAIYPFVSSLLIPHELMAADTSGGSEKEALARAKKKMAATSDEEWAAYAWRIHEKLANDADGTYKNGSGMERWYDGDIDKMNSERFPSATAKEYAELMQKINSRTYFSKEVQTYLHPLLEGIMENPANKQWLQHAGKKGGSTAYILTDAMYATTKEGTRIELAVFFHHLQPEEVEKLTGSLNEFELLLLQDKAFQTKVSSELQ